MGLLDNSGKAKGMAFELSNEHFVFMLLTDGSRARNVK